MAHFIVSHSARNVNTKRLQQRIVDTVTNTAEEFVYVRTALYSSTSQYDFTQVADYLDMFMEQLVDEKVVTTYDIIGDTRNNDPSEMTRGHYVVDIQFQQYNCLNTTYFTFEIDRT